jgi:hypothetical protein
LGGLQFWGYDEVVLVGVTFGFRRLATALVLSALAVGCGQAVMAVPPELGAGATSYPVHGRQGFLILNPEIGFGSFTTNKLRRGITIGSGELEPGLLSSTSKRENHTVSTFAMQDWRGMCEARFTSESTTETTGVGISSERGLHADKTESVVESHSYVCELTGHEGQRLHLELSDSAGWVVDRGGIVLYNLSPIREKMTMKHPELRGYLIESNSNDSVAAVQTSFDGVVYFAQNLDSKQRAELAVVCVAVLLHGD